MLYYGGNMNKITDIYKKRRSIYALGNTISITDKELISIIENCLLHAPSAFNSQSGRIVLLLGNEHKKLWEIALKTLAPIAIPEKFTTTELKIASFASGYGSILFFEDDKIIADLQKKYPLYKDAFFPFSYQSSGMLQYMVWTALASKNIGASLQHYNPLIDDSVKKYWEIPENWRLISQLPFGNIEAPAENKQFASLEQRIKIFK